MSNIKNQYFEIITLANYWYEIQSVHLCKKIRLKTDYDKVQGLI
jgi:hypothetical protein